MTKFTELGLSGQIMSALEDFGYSQPTEIQEKTIPDILSGRDVIASAQTGSGKTAAYALPVIQLLQASEKTRRPRVLVLVPTRELAIQVEKQFELFAKYSRLQTVTLYGGTGYERQTRLLRRGVDVVVATPGRLLDHIERKNADLSRVAVLILDEADRLLDMGFMPQVKKVIARLPVSRQTLMFSATIDERIKAIAAEHMSDPVRHRANSRQIEPAEIDQRIYHVSESGKDALLVRLINDESMGSVIVFTRTRRKASRVSSRLRESNVMAEEIHGDISQSKREKTLSRYREGLFPVLVATDVAARGLDVPSISHVINYDLPESPEDYVHRIGRTGRAGRSGVALSFVCEGQRHLIRDIERIIGRCLDPKAKATAKATAKAPATAAARQFGGRRPCRIV